MKIIYQQLLLALLIIIGSASLSGQTENDLNQKVTIEATNVTISELLKNIGEQARIKFSYNPKLIKSNNRVNVSAEKETVRNVLNGVFRKKFDYKLRGNYVIIAEQKVSSDELVKASKTILSGYVIDAETQDGISKVSIYTSAGASSLTDETGAFKITLNKDENSLLELRKKDYQSTTFESNHSSSNDLEIALNAIQSISIQLHRDSIDTKRLNAPHIGIATMYQINTSLQANQDNITDSIRKPVSFSLYPGLATYGNLSGNIKFNLAINFIGYNRGIKGAEFSLFSGINRDDVEGLQLAGLSNYVGNNVTGYQAASIFNKVGGDLEGVQMAGITNVNLKNITGAQFAGINNHVIGDVIGLQVAGIYNITDDVKGMQVSGIWNIADTISGIQMAGIGNHAKNCEGLQLSGLYNYADTISGAQISGLVNVGHIVKGSQIGIINVADSLSGIPIGIFNFIKNGYKRIGVNTDELFPINIEFRTGVNKFYTILSAGMQTDVFDSDSSFYTFGMGFGSRYPISKSFAIEIDATANHITKRKYTNDLSLNLKGSIGLEFQLSKHFSLAGGATYNAYILDRNLLADADFESLRDEYLVDTSDEMNKNVWRSWIGYRAGLRFAF